MLIKDISENTELSDVAKLFYGDEFPHIGLSDNDGVYEIVIGSDVFRCEYDSADYDIIPSSHKNGRMSKIALYDALYAFTGRKMPWGALTGVRPTKLFYECLKGGKTADEAVQTMQNVYRVDSKRAVLLRDIIDAQKGKVNYSSDYINLYIHIPYCTTRCTYCSFVSAPIDKNISQSHEYVKLLCDEIAQSVALIKDSGKKVLSVYIGGGTPTALDHETFELLLGGVGEFDCEYTCEAGRPDTVTQEKADIMKAHNVTRVCVNPQTLCENTLEKIGRRHSVSDFYAAYDIVNRCGFDINCDLIAGLADETADDFKSSFDGVKRLMPQNITVHSLSRKNGSAIRYDRNENQQAEQMIDYALIARGEYIPYYLYRQKRQASNLENIGFTLDNAQCVNNITTMEETVGVMACGAGAISKYVGDGKICRFANMRDVPLYIKNFDEKVKAKLDFFKEQFLR